MKITEVNDVPKPLEYTHIKTYDHIHALRILHGVQIGSGKSLITTIHKYIDLKLINHLMMQN